MKKRDHQAWVSQLIEELEGIGAVHGNAGIYDWMLETKYGPLRISIDNLNSEFTRGSKTCFWPTVFTRFETDAAHEAGLTSRNGKWNFHFGDTPAADIPIVVAEVVGKLNRILP